MEKKTLGENLNILLSSENMTKAMCIYTVDAPVLKGFEILKVNINSKTIFFPSLILN